MAVNFAVVIPTLNGGARAKKLFSTLKQQTLQPQQVLVIDSASTDNTCQTARSYGFEVEVIPRQAFNHGGTRQMAAERLKEVDVIVYLTQDTVLADSDTLATLLRAFVDPLVAAAFGRQLPHINAGPIGAHARLFNYSDVSIIKSMADAPRLGLKTPFLSNSFAAYRRCDLLAVGGFPSHVIFGEDMFVAAKLLMIEKKIAYVAAARAYHSHDYSIREEFKRCFDIGVFHAREPWLRQTFGRAEGEGLRFVRSELTYLWRHGDKKWIPAAFIRNICKFIGYHLGLKEANLSVFLKMKMSMNHNYWRAQQNGDTKTS